MNPSHPEKWLPAASPGTGGIPFTQIPDHQLLRKIGGGSYGEVWLACSTLGSYRAVKIVYRRNFAHDRPFEREFTGIQKYEPISRSQDGLMDILQVGRNHDAGCFYYVMELADDVSCGAKINPDSYTPRTLAYELSKRRRLPFEECLDIGLALSSALPHLHKHGLVHRDVKPSNVIFVKGVPELADIGLVTEVAEARSYVGTEGFIPPEGPGTAQADIYSLGKVLYEISTGKDRFDYPELPASLDDTTGQHELIELNEIVLKACRADTHERYQSADRMHSDLLLLQRGRSIKQVRKLQRRLAVATRVGIVAVAAALLALGAWVGSIKQIRRARQAERKAEEVARFLRDMISGVDPDVAKGRDTILLQAIVSNAVNRVQKELKNQPEVQAELLATLGESYAAFGFFEKGEALLRRAVNLESSLRNPTDPKLAEATRKLGYTLGSGGKMDEAEKLYRKLLTQAMKLHGRESLEVAFLQKDLSGVLMAGQNLPEAEAMARESLATLQKLLGYEHFDVAGSLNELAAVYYKQQRFEESEKFQRKALAIQTNVLGNEHTDVATSINNIACVLWKQGKFAEAIGMQRKAISLRLKLLPPYHPWTAGGKVTLAKMLLFAGRLEEAEPAFDDAANCARLSKDKHQIAGSLDGMGQLRLAQRNLPEAESSLREALTMRQQILGKGSYLETLTLNNLAEVLTAQHKLADAETALREALATQRTLLAADDLDLAATLENLGLVLEKQANTAEAEQSARECLGIREKRWPDDWRRFSAGSLLGGCLLKQNEYAEAERLLTSGYEGLKQRADRIPFNSKARLKEALERLIELYQITNRPEDAAGCKLELAKLAEM